MFLKVIYFLKPTVPFDRDAVEVLNVITVLNVIKS